MDDEFEARVENRLRTIRVSEEAQRRHADAKQQRFQLPPAGRTLAHDLAQPVRETKYTIGELHPVDGNTLLVAQHKTGKTTLLLNLAKSLADGTPFLGRFPVRKLDGRVAFWNYELGADMFREWARDVGVEHTQCVAEPLHLRGVALPFWLPDVGEEAADWLKRSEVEFLIIDPAAQAWRGIVDNENDNGQLTAFTGALDELKRRAGVSDLVLATHMGRQVHEENNERSRGGTRLEDWMDAGWYLRKDKEERRSLRATGRDVAVEAFELSYDSARREYRHTGQTRTQRREQDGLQNVVDALAELERTGEYPATTNALADAMVGDKNGRSRLITAAVDAGLIVRKPEGKKLLCELTERGRQMVRRRVSRSAKPPRRKRPTT